MVPYDGTPIKDQLAAQGRLRGNVCNPDYDFLDPRIIHSVPVVFPANVFLILQKAGLFFCLLSVNTLPGKRFHWPVERQTTDLPHHYLWS